MKQPTGSRHPCVAAFWIITMQNPVQQEEKSFRWLSTILDILRRDCPWDREQTIESLRYLTIEEVYELSEAIIAGDYDEMRKELGDLFLHLLFYSKIADDEGRFSTSDVIDGICRKLIARHPHIPLPDRDGVMQPARQQEKPEWEKVKMREGRHSVLEGVPPSLPPLVKAVRIQEKAAGIGFEFNNSKEAHSKVEEEYAEFIEALQAMHGTADGCRQSEGVRRHATEELGDLLFAIIKWARFEGLNADDALMQANLKFQNRFNYVETMARRKGMSLGEMTLDEMTALWDEAKKEERRHQHTDKHT